MNRKKFLIYILVIIAAIPIAVCVVMAGQIALGQMLLMYAAYSSDIYGEYRLSWEPDGDRFVVCCTDYITIYNSELDIVSQRDQVYRTPVGEQWISVSWSQNISYLRDNINIWDVQNNVVTQLSNTSSPTAWSLTGELIATKTYENTIQIYDGDTYEILFTLPNFTYVSSQRQLNDLVSTLEWSPDGNLLASKYSSSALRVWDVTTGELVYSMESAGGLISWRSNHQLAITSGMTIDILDINTGIISNSIPIYGRIIEWNPNDSNVIALAANEQIIIWDVSAERIVQQFENHTQRITDIGWNSAGSLLASIDVSGILNLWDVNSGMLLHSTEIE